MLLRQDPPFDLGYITTTHILERIHPKTLVVNNPAQVRNAPEKIFVLEFPDLMPATLITRDKDEIEAFRAEHGEIVMKPLYGNGGAAVFKVGREGPNFGSLFDLFSVTFREPWVVQRFLPAGQRRATSGSSWSTATHGRGEPCAGRERHPFQHGAGGAAETTQLSDRGAGDMRPHRSVAQGTWA